MSKSTNAVRSNTMTYSTDTEKALAVISGKLGKSISLLRQQWGIEGMTDADLIDRINGDLGLGHICWEGGALELSASEREWLDASLFRVHESGRIYRGEGKVRLSVAAPAGSYDANAFRRAWELSDDDQRYALAAFGVNAGAADPEMAVTA
jgi:hypothetical protein